MHVLRKTVCAAGREFSTAVERPAVNPDGPLPLHEQPLLDQAQDAIFVHDFGWRVQYWNNAAAALYGWSLAEVREKNLKNDVFQTDEVKLLAAFEQVLLTGKWSGELRQANRAGSSLVVLSRWTLLRDETGQPRSILVINTDVTAQKKLEVELARAQRLESIGTLAGGIAHDLNNVLTPIVMAVELMKLNQTDENTLKMLNTMGGSARRGAELIRQVLLFARGQGGERRTLQLDPLVRELQNAVRKTFPQTIELDAQVGNVLPVTGDAGQIHQALLNLCRNARDAMPEGGRITVTTRNVTFTEAEARMLAGARPISYVRLSVADTGPGVAPEIMDRIFEPFFTTREVGQGAGLGLAIVLSIVKSHGGMLEVKSEIGRGATFHLYFPADTAAIPAVPPTADLSPDTLSGQGETVMVVDDEPSVLELTRTVLEHYGYTVVTAIHGADALARHAQHRDKIKLVLMDMMMPVMDGPSAIRALRQQDPALRFIAISGVTPGDKLREQLGVEVPFLAKPCSSTTLLSNLRRSLHPVS